MAFGGRPPGYGRGRARGAAAPPPPARFAPAPFRPLSHLFEASAGRAQRAQVIPRGPPLSRLFEDDDAAAAGEPADASAAAGAAGAPERGEAAEGDPPAGGRQGGFFAGRPALSDRSVGGVLRFAAGDPTNRPRRIAAVLGQERDRSDDHVASVALQAALHHGRPNTRRTYDTWVNPNGCRRRSVRSAAVPQRGPAVQVSDNGPQLFLSGGVIQTGSLGPNRF
eukprot:gene28943-41915_t